jgi:hypothetical protein
VNKVNEEKLIELLSIQREMAIQLKSLRDQESAIRREICDHILEGKEVGTHKFTFGNLKVKAVKSYTYSLDQELVAQMIENGDFADDELEAIKTKYELSISAYKKLDASDNLDDCITVKDSMPTLTVEEV